MRIQSIDVARGLCIVLVAWGHIPAFNDTWLNQVLSTCRMPLMFFIAGSFFKPASTWRTLLGNKTDALIKPFLVMVLLQAPLRLWMGHTTPESLLLGVLAGGGHYLVWIFGLWYLTHLWCLFIVAQAVHGWARFSQWPNHLKILTALALLTFGNALTAPLAGLLLPPANISGESVLSLPFMVEHLPRNLGFFLLGQLLHERVRQWHFSWLKLSAAAGAFASMHALLTLDGAPSDSLTSLTPAWITLRSLSGMAMLLTLAAGFCSWTLSRQCLAHCGRESIFILLFHSLIAHGVTWLFNRGLPSAPELSALVCWVASVGLSLWLAHIIRRHDMLSAMWLPRKQIQRHRLTRASITLAHKSNAMSDKQPDNRPSGFAHENRAA